MSATTKILGPLTTTFSPPSDCLSQTFRYTRSDLLCGSSHCGWLHLGNASDTSCVPSGYEARSSTDFFYSPGVCPKSYTAACSNVFTSGSQLQTIATCCPKLFSCQTGTRWPWYQTEACVREFPSTLTLLMTYIEEDDKTRTVPTTGIGVNAYGIKIRNSSTASYLPSSVSASPTPTQASISNGSDSATDTNGGLSVGAKAGIGVGAGVGGLLILLFAAFFFWKVWNSRQNKAAADTRPEYRSELDGSSNVDVYRPPMQTPAQQHMAELEGKPASAQAELDGGRSAIGPVPNTTTERFELG